MVQQPDPYEIPGMGLGLCVIRKDAWPGMPDGLGGFGGEELHLHEVVRTEGRKAICLPFLKWLHRFGYVGATPYPNIVEEKLRNNLVWEKHLKAIQTKPFSYYDYDLRSAWSTSGRSLVRRPTFSVAPRWGDHMGVVARTSRRKLPRLLLWTKARSRRCTSALPRCGRTFTNTFRRCANFRRNAIRWLSFGCRHGTSSVGILAGKPKKFVTVDLARQAEVDTLTRLAGDTDFSFVLGDSLSVEIPECDLLFIDTKHTGITSTRNSPAMPRNAAGGSRSTTLRFTGSSARGIPRRSLFRVCSTGFVGFCGRTPSGA